MANIQIPLLLGEIVNVVARFTGDHTEEGNNYIKEITDPTMKIIKFYVAQVGTIGTAVCSCRIVCFLYNRNTIIYLSIFFVYFSQQYEKFDRS